MQMPASDEPDGTSCIVPLAVVRELRVDLFNVIDDDDFLVKLHFSQGGILPLSFLTHWIVITLAGTIPHIIDPDFKLSISGGSIPILLGEVGVSNRLNNTKLKSKLWIESLVLQSRTLERISLLIPTIWREED